MSDLVPAGSRVRVTGRNWYGRPVEVECVLYTATGEWAFCEVVSALVARLKSEHRGVRAGSVYVRGPERGETYE